MNDFPADSSFQFAQPLWLLAGALVTLAILFLFRLFDRKREADLAQLVHPRFRSQLFAGVSPTMKRLKRLLWISAIFLIFVTLARPQQGAELREVKRRGIDLLFAIDTSQSMLANDLSPNRMERAKLGINDFVNRLEGDRVGLIPFAGSAYALCPLTLDYDAFLESLQTIQTNMIPHQGTDLASAIREAERLFKENQNNQKILILITDGEDLQGDVLDTAKKAAKDGLVIYTVGVGSPDGATIPIQYRNGQTDVMRDEKGQEIRTKLDEATLKKIAEISNALYVPLGRGAEGLDTIYQEKLRLVPKTESSKKFDRIPYERYEWPLLAAIILLLIEFFLPDRTKANRRAFATATVAAIPLVTTLLLLAAAPQANADQVVSYNQGTEAYHRGEFAQAADSLREALKTADLDLQRRTYYNLGNTLYRHGQASLEKEPATTIKRWQESLKAYEDAMTLDSGDADARYNHALVKKKLEQLQQQQPQENKDQNKDENNKDQQEKDQQKQEDQKQQDQQNSEDKDSEKKDGEKKDGEKKDGEKKDGEKKDGEKKDGKENQQQKGEESEEKKKAEEGKESAEEKSEQEKEAQQAQENKEGKPAQQPREMTKEEALQLLQSLRHEERQVIPIPQNRRDGKTDNTTKGKTW